MHGDLTLAHMTGMFLLLLTLVTRRLASQNAHWEAGVLCCMSLIGASQ